MLQKRLKDITTFSLNEANRTKFRQKIFEFELSNGLLKIAEVVRKSKEFRLEEGSTLEGRVELGLAFAGLVARPPHAFETRALSGFLNVVKNAVDQVKHNSLEKFKKLLHTLETELFILATVRYYYYRDDGQESDDADENCERFRQAAHRLLVPLTRPNVIPGNPKHDLAIERNLRINDVMSIFDGGVFFDDRFQDFIEMLFNEEEILKCAQQFTLELQRLLYGADSWAGAELVETSEQTNKVADKVVVHASNRSTKDRAANDHDEVVRESKKPKVKHEVEEKKESDIAKSTKTAPVQPTKAANASSPLKVPDLPPKVVIKAAPKQTQVVMERKRVPELGETQPDFTSPGSSSESPTKKYSGRMPFSEDEDLALRLGVERHGVGKWKQILEDPEFALVFRSVKPRTTVNLKDRYRNMPK